MSRRKFRLTAPKNWERKKYSHDDKASIMVESQEDIYSSPLVIKIARPIADVALITSKASQTSFDGWCKTRVH